MATTTVIEEEWGTCSTRRHPHNGYYAGSFTTAAEPTSLSMVVLRTAVTMPIR